MLGLFRLPILKSVKIAQFGVKKFAQPIPRVLRRSYGSNGQRFVNGPKVSTHERILSWIETELFRMYVFISVLAFLTKIINASQPKQPEKYVEDITNL